MTCYGCQLSLKKLRKSDDFPESFVNSKKIKGKQIGIDGSVIFQKGIGANNGAGNFHAKQSVKNCEVINKINCLCSFVNRNDVKLVVSIDGKYHSMKERENNKMR